MDREQAQKNLDKTGLKFGDRVVTLSSVDLFPPSGSGKTALKGTRAIIVGASEYSSISGDFCLRADDDYLNTKKFYAGIVDGVDCMMWRLYKRNEFKKIDYKIDKEGNLI